VNVDVDLLGYIRIILERRRGHTSCAKCFNSSFKFTPGLVQQHCEYRKWICLWPAVGGRL